jgi:hypothetical protein
MGPLPETRKPFSVVSHDGWGRTSVGEFESLEGAQNLFRALCVDRWFLTDGSVKGLSIVENGGGRILESFRFQKGWTGSVELEKN